LGVCALTVRRQKDEVKEESKHILAAEVSCRLECVIEESGNEYRQRFARCESCERN
jgi:hypothetical protein